MNRMKKIMIVFTIPACVAFLACGNREKLTEPMAIGGQSVLEESQADTIPTPTPTQIESLKEEEKPSAHVSSSSSSSRSSKSTKYDNMRGFDPSSEDDMDDNGMSRYMENNDEEGWD